MKNAQDGMREKKESLKLFFPTRPFHHSIRLGLLTFRDPLLLCGVLYILLWMDAGGFLRAGLWAAFLHEMGHLLAYGMMLRKLPRVDVTITGFCLRVPRESLRRAQLFGLAAAGPGMNLLLAAVWAVRMEQQATVRGWAFLTANLLTAGFNLLPIPPLDGYELCCVGWELVSAKRAAPR